MMLSRKMLNSYSKVSLMPMRLVLSKLGSKARSKVPFSPAPSASRPGRKTFLTCNATMIPSCLAGGGVGVVLGAAVLGLFVGVGTALLIVRNLRASLDPLIIVRENTALRAKVGELSELLNKIRPMGPDKLKLKFKRGIDRTVILGIVDQLLQNKEVNIWWLPDDVERLFYCNVITLLLAVMDEVVDSMSIKIAGHDVRLELTHLSIQEVSHA
jgi:hypothetical protein